MLNSTYEPLNVCSSRRALVLLLKEKAEAIEASAGIVHSERQSFSVPHVIRLRNYVSVPRQARTRISRRAIFARDHYRCQYCGSDKHLTIDHIVPRSKGGDDSWENVVTSCARCNLKKGDRLPQAVNMTLRRAPKAPGPFSFVLMYANEMHDSWKPYLAFAGLSV